MVVAGGCAWDVTVASFCGSGKTLNMFVVIVVVVAVEVEIYPCDQT